MPKKWSLRAHDQQTVFVARRGEGPEQVVMKALLWALYLPEYPDLSVGASIRERYRPDVAALTFQQEPVFWGDASELSVAKIHALVKRYRGTHFALAWWGLDLEDAVEQVQKALRKVKRKAPIDVVCFPEDSLTRFIVDDGTLSITHDDVEWTRL